jgi:hypothetical protein
VHENALIAFSSVLVHILFLIVDFLLILLQPEITS